jgi:hypothetical protein
VMEARIDLREVGRERRRRAHRSFRSSWWGPWIHRRPRPST